jgi:hypothetical protein
MREFNTKLHIKTQESRGLGEFEWRPRDLLIALKNAHSSASHTNHLAEAEQL